MLDYMDYLGVPATVAICIAVVFLVIQIIGELLEFKGKVVPEFCKVRKYFARKKAERESLNQLIDIVAGLKDELKETNNMVRTLSEKTNENNKKITDIRLDIMRNEIINFASKVHDVNSLVTRERFRRILKLYDEYEDMIRKEGRTNGEVDVAHRIITESYEEHMRNHTFVEDVRGW